MNQKYKYELFLYCKRRDTLQFLQSGFEHCKQMGFLQEIQKYRVFLLFWYVQTKQYFRFKSVLDWFKSTLESTVGSSLISPLPQRETSFFILVIFFFFFFGLTFQETKAIELFEVLSEMHRISIYKDHLLSSRAGVRSTLWISWFF